MARAFKILVSVLAVLGLFAGLFWYAAFGGNSPIEDGKVLAPGVTVVKDGFTSVALLDIAQGKVALVDAGNDKQGAAILAALAKRGLGPDAVRAIFLTHGHGDHTAGCKLFPGARIFAMKPELGVIGDAARVTDPLEDGSDVDVDGLRVEAYAVPGHTPGSAVYFARGVVFFGDSAGASTEGKMTRAVRMFTSDSPQNVSSLKHLASRLEPRDKEIAVLAFAHTGPLPTLFPLRVFARDTD
jgi:glyoxylase-like metal-dependent hydrolase (beta-lactamase superfamily II)